MSSTWRQQGSTFLRLSGQEQAHRGAAQALPPCLCWVLTLTDAAVAAERQREKPELLQENELQPSSGLFTQTRQQCLHVCGCYQEAC